MEPPVSDHPSFVFKWSLKRGGRLREEVPVAQGVSTVIVYTELYFIRSSQYSNPKTTTSGGVTVQIYDLYQKIQSRPAEAE